MKGRTNLLGQTDPTDWLDWLEAPKEQQEEQQEGMLAGSLQPGGPACVDCGFQTCLVFGYHPSSLLSVAFVWKTSSVFWLGYIQLP